MGPGGTGTVSGLKSDSSGVGSLTRCYVQQGLDVSVPPSTKTVAAATCRCSGTALRLSWGAFFFGEHFFLHSFFAAGET